MKLTLKLYVSSINDCWDSFAFVLSERFGLMMESVLL